MVWWQQVEITVLNEHGAWSIIPQKRNDQGLGGSGTALGGPARDMWTWFDDEFNVERETLEVRRTELLGAPHSPWSHGVIESAGGTQSPPGDCSNAVVRLKRTEKDRREPVRSSLMLLKWPDAVFVCLAAW